MKKKAIGNTGNMKTFLKYFLCSIYGIISLFAIYQVFYTLDYKGKIMWFAQKHMEDANNLLVATKNGFNALSYNDNSDKTLYDIKHTVTEEIIQPSKNDKQRVLDQNEKQKILGKNEKERQLVESNNIARVEPTRLYDEPAYGNLVETAKKQTASFDARRDHYHDYEPPFKCSTLHWKDIINPCKNLMKWELKSYNKSEHTSVLNSKFYINSKPSKAKSDIKIVTFSNSGEKKVIGGDFWWMNVIGPSSFHVDLKDNADGTYESYFSFMEPGNYTVTVELIWSLCDGLRDPPSWWFKSGDDQGKYQKRGSLGEDTYIGQKKSFVLTIADDKKQENIAPYREDIPNKCKPINAHCGYWKNDNQFITSKNQKQPQLPKQKKLPKRSTIYFHGDSLQFRLHDYFLSRPICKKLYNCNLTYTWVYPNPPSKHIYDNKDFNKTIILNSIRNVLMHPDVLQQSSVVLINFGLHLMMDISFDEAADLLHHFIQLVRDLKTRYGDRFPRIVWKSTTAPFERERYKYNEDHRRFLTKQRTIMWNAYTRQVLCDANIPILDIYYMAASFMPGTLDGVHYVGHVFQTAALAFESYILDS